MLLRALVIAALAVSCSDSTDPVLDQVRSTTNCGELANIMAEHVFGDADPEARLTNDQQRVFDAALARTKELGC